MCKYTPLKNLCIANHKIIKRAFALNSDSVKYADLVMQNRQLNFTTFGKIVSKPRVDKPKKTYRFQVKYPCTLHVIENPLLNLNDAERENLKKKPNLFDRLIFTALTSAYHEGIKEISVAALYRIITGKTNHNCRPSKKHAAEILASVKKLACLRVRIDATDAFKSYTHKDSTPKYNDGKPLVIDFTPVIPCTIFDGTFQSKTTTEIIKLTAESPLFKVARLMNQLLTVPREVLDAGNTRCTGNVYNVKFYTLIRTLENKKANCLKDVITFDNIFKKCGVDNANSTVKATARDTISAILLNLQNADVLKSFKIIRDGVEFEKIELTYTTKSKKNR